jgi:hypothetical protein
MARRAIGRAATSDFHAFPLPETILEPGPAMDPSESFYTNCRTTLPGAPDQHLLFPAIWSTVTDRTRLALYASHDGAHWQAVPGGDCLLDTAPFGEWDGGCVFGVPNLEELPTGDFVLPYTGYNVPHKYPRVQATRNTAYARWPKGRLVALEAPERGEFATVAVVPPGSRLTVNAVVGRAGHLLIEAFSLNQRPIRGREFANALPLTGDLHWAPVTWKNADDLGIEKGEAVGLRIKMEDAKLFGLGFG